MEKDYGSSKMSTRSPWQRVFCLFLVFASVVGLLPATAWAEDIWDGSGSGGDGNGSTIASGAVLESTSAYYSIMGYRFTVYNAGGSKVGGPIDIDIRSTFTWYRAPEKKSHIDLYREYLDHYNGGKFNGPEVSLGGTFTTSKSGVYDDPGLPDTRTSSGAGPSAIGDWLQEGDNAGLIAKTYCKVSAYDANTHFIIVEPMFAVSLFGDGNWYALTMAELAVFQSGQVEASRKAYNSANPGTYTESVIDGWTHTTPYSKYSIFIVRKIPKK